MFQKYKPTILIIIILFLFTCCLACFCCAIFFGFTAASLNSNSFGEQYAISKVQKAYPTLSDYPSNSLPPRSIKSLNADGGWYLAFIQEGSGRPILEAKCYFVDKDNNVSEIGTYLPTTSNDSAMGFSPKTCLPTNSSSSNSSSDNSCGVINCHDLSKINCGKISGDMACTASYQLGDKCIHLATCGVQNGVCGQTQNTAFDNCKTCVQKCESDFRNDITGQFECEAKCE